MISAGDEHRRAGWVAEPYDPRVPSLTLIVPATNEPATLEHCLAAIDAAREPPEEILVVLSEPPGAGPAAARNFAAERATGDVLVFVDSDVAVHSDAFERVRRTFAERPEIDALVGSYDDEPPAPGLVSIFRNLLHHHVHQTSPGPAQTFWAGLGAIRREVFAGAGGFDATRFGPPCVEDVELGMRLGESGARTELDPELLGAHMKGWTLRSMVRTDINGRTIPWVGVLLRRRTLPPVLNLGWSHRASALAAVAAAVATARGRPRGAITAIAVLGALNRSFYVLLLRKLGPARALLGVGLHLIHHLSAVSGVPLGLLHYLRGGSRTEGPLRSVTPRLRVERHEGRDQVGGAAARRNGDSPSERRHPPQRLTERVILG